MPAYASHDASQPRSCEECYARNDTAVVMRTAVRDAMRVRVDRIRSVRRCDRSIDLTKFIIVGMPLDLRVSLRYHGTIMRRAWGCS